MGKQLATEGKSQAVFGQSLAEFTLIGGLVSLVAVGGIGLLVTSFSSKQNELFGFFGQSPAPPAAPVEVNGNNNALQGSGTPALEAAQPVTTSLDISTLKAQNSQLNSLYEGIQNGTASLAEVSGWYGGTAQNNLGFVTQLELAAKALEKTNPSMAADLFDLARTGKILAGFQLSTASEAAWIDNGGRDDEENHAYNELIKKMAAETNTVINGYTPDGNLVQTPQGGDLSNPLEAAQATQQWAETFSRQWQSIQQNPAVLDALNEESRHNVSNAATSIEAHANIYTDVNGLQTYDNSQAIQTEQEKALASQQ